MPEAGATAYSRARTEGLKNDNLINNPNSEFDLRE